MVKSERCLRKWYLNVKRLGECRSRGRLSEWRLSRWTRCISRLRHHRLKEGGLKLSTLWLEWRNVKLGLSLLIATLRVYSNPYLSYLGPLLNSGMYLSLSLSLGLCWCSPYPGTIYGLLKFHPHHWLIITCIISVGGLKVRLSAQADVGILEYSNKETTIGEYASTVLASWDHVHHHKVP